MRLMGPKFVGGIFFCFPPPPRPPSRRTCFGRYALHSLTTRQPSVTPPGEEDATRKEDVARGTLRPLSVGTYCSPSAHVRTDTERRGIRLLGPWVDDGASISGKKKGLEKMGGARIG